MKHIACTLAAIVAFQSLPAFAHDAKASLDPGELFAQKYPFLADATAFEEIPFDTVPEATARHVLAGKNIFLPFGSTISPRRQLYLQLYSVNCPPPAAVDLICHYLVAQGGFGDATTRVYGPVDLAID